MVSPALEIMGMEMPKLARRAARESGVKLMVHIGDTEKRYDPTVIRSLLPLLDRGDILTHYFTANPGGVLDGNGKLVPEVNVLYGLRCEGAFSHLVRFETSSAEGPISLAELVRNALEISGAPAIGMVMVVESAGLVGPALRRSPAGATGEADAPFKYPEVRSWLSFSTERLYSRSLALISGVATSSECAPLASLLRPLGTGAWPMGHFHAAAFSYRPLQKGSIDLKTTVTTLFETETLQGVLHLLTDDRVAAGPQQSEFVRGACWIGAASEIR